MSILGWISPNEVCQSEITIQRRHDKAQFSFVKKLDISSILEMLDIGKSFKLVDDWTILSFGKIFGEEILYIKTYSIPEFGGDIKKMEYKISCDEYDVCEDVTISGKYALIKWKHPRAGIYNDELWRLDPTWCFQIQLPEYDYLTDEELADFHEHYLFTWLMDTTGTSEYLVCIMEVNGDHIFRSLQSTCNRGLCRNRKKVYGAVAIYHGFESPKFIHRLAVPTIGMTDARLVLTHGIQQLGLLLIGEPERQNQALNWETFKYPGFISDLINDFVAIPNFKPSPRHRRERFPPLNIDDIDTVKFSKISHDGESFLFNRKNNYVIAHDLDAHELIPAYDCDSCKRKSAKTEPKWKLIAVSDTRLLWRIYSQSNSKKQKCRHKVDVLVEQDYLIPPGWSYSNKDNESIKTSNLDIYKSLELLIDFSKTCPLGNLCHEVCPVFLEGSLVLKRDHKCDMTVSYGCHGCHTEQRFRHLHQDSDSFSLLSSNSASFDGPYKILKIIGDGTMVRYKIEHIKSGVQFKCQRESLVQYFPQNHEAEKVNQEIKIVKAATTWMPRKPSERFLTTVALIFGRSGQCIGRENIGY